jgi:hypothetical protein
VKYIYARPEAVWGSDYLSRAILSGQHLIQRFGRGVLETPKTTRPRPVRLSYHQINRVVMARYWQRRVRLHIPARIYMHTICSGCSVPQLQPLPRQLIVFNHDQQAFLPQHPHIHHPWACFIGTTPRTCPRPCSQTKLQFQPV